MPLGELEVRRQLNASLLRVLWSGTSRFYTMPPKIEESNVNTYAHCQAIFPTGTCPPACVCMYRHLRAQFSVYPRFSRPTSGIWQLVTIWPHGALTEKVQTPPYPQAQEGRLARPRHGVNPRAHAAVTVASACCWTLWSAALCLRSWWSMWACTACSLAWVSHCFSGAIHYRFYS